MTENILAHRWVGGHVPLGYKLTTDKQLQIVPKEAESVKLIYNMYHSGERIINIVRYLNAHRYKTALGRAFNRSSLTRILQNKIYIGIYQWDGHLVKDFAPPIISTILWKAVQERFERHTENPRPKQLSTDYALTGLIYCGECGLLMTGQSGYSRNGTLYHYYRCSAKNNYRFRSKKHNVDCKSRNISRDKIEDIVLQATISILRNPKAIKMIAEQTANVQKNDPTAQEQTRILKELKSIQQSYSFIIQKGFEITINGQRITPLPISLLFDDKDTASIKPFLYQQTFGDVHVSLAIGFYAPPPSPEDIDDENNLKRSSSDAGWTIVCNDRVVLYNDKTHLTGWGEAGVPQYHTQFIGIRGIVIFESNNPKKSSNDNYKTWY